MKQYSFNGVLDNNKFKKRKLAGIPANNYIIARVFWNHRGIEERVFDSIREFCISEYVDGLQRSVGEEHAFNGEDLSSFPTDIQSSSISLEITNGFNQVDAWYSKVVNKESNYMSDVLVLVLDQADRVFRMYGYRDAWVSSVRDKRLEQKQDKNVIFTKSVILKHSGMRLLDFPEPLTVIGIDGKERELSKSDKFYAESNMYFGFKDLYTWNGAEKVFEDKGTKFTVHNFFR